MPHSKTPRRHTHAAVAQLVGHWPFKPSYVGSNPTGGNNPRGSEALTAKHSALNRANGVRLPADPRLPDSGSVNGRPLRSDRRTPLGDRPMAGRQALTLSIEVRVLVPERLRCATKQIFDNRIVDDARGRAPPRPQLALVADLVMAPARRAGDAGSIPDEGTINRGTLRGFHTSRDGLREAKPRCARRDQHGGRGVVALHVAL